MRSVWVALGLFVDAVVDLDRLRGPLQPARRRRAARAAAVPGGQRPGRRRRRRDRPGVDRRQHGLRAEPRRRRGSCSPRAHVMDRAGREALRAADRARSWARPRSSRSRSGSPSRGATCCGRSPSRASRARCCTRTARRRAGARARATCTRCAGRRRRGARPAPLRGALRAVPDHPARRGRGRGGPGRDRRARRDVRRLGRARRGDDLRRGALVAVLRRGGGHQPARARAVRRLADDGAGDLRGRAHAPVLRAAPDRRRASGCCWRRTRRRSRTRWPRSGWASTCSGRASSCARRTGPAARRASCCSSRPSRCTACTPSCRPTRSSGSSPPGPSGVPRWPWARGGSSRTTASASPRRRTRHHNPAHRR